MLLGVASTGLGVLGFLALALALVNYRRLRWLRFFQVSAFALLGMSYCLLVVEGALRGEAIDFTRHLEWFSRSDHPRKFWASVAVNGSLGVLGPWIALRIARQPLGPPLGLVTGDLTPRFLNVVRWIILGLAVGAIALWGRALLARFV